MEESAVNIAIGTDRWMATKDDGLLRGCQNWRVILILYLFCWFIPAFFETLELIYVVHFPLREKRQWGLIANHIKQFTDMSTGAMDPEPLMDPLYGHMVSTPAQITDAPNNKSALEKWVQRKENLYELAQKAARSQLAEQHDPTRSVANGGDLTRSGLLLSMQAEGRHRAAPAGDASTPSSSHSSVAPEPEDFEDESGIYGSYSGVYKPEFPVESELFDGDAETMMTERDALLSGVDDGINDVDESNAPCAGPAADANLMVEFEQMLTDASVGAFDTLGDYNRSHVSPLWHNTHALANREGAHRAPPGGS